jgi:hypothetical protein
MIAILLGGAQTWFTRHRIFSDGISYLEIAQQYAQGDWHGALNAYWSPLYSWVIAAYLMIFRPTPYWQVASLHVVNFAAFLAAFRVFEKFVQELIALRPACVMGFSPVTLTIVGYVATLHAGLLMVGIGYPSPDLIALFLTGTAAWLTLRVARVERNWGYLAALGAVLGLGYLDRTAFAPWSAVYFVTLGIFGSRNVGRLALCLLCFVAVSAPFVLALSVQRGSWTMGESGKLNYGWEVDGAARSIHWQGEPGDIGKPAHPTRMILKTPVPVYEFGEPVEGSYPPWRDPSYWYEGIRPHLKLKEQLKVLGMNVRTTILFLATAPAFIIWFLAIAANRGRGIGFVRWPPVYWVLTLTAAAGIAMYCLVFVDKRYVAGFLAVLWITALAGVATPKGRLGEYADIAAQSVAWIFLAAIAVWLRPALTMSVRDALAGREGEYNVSWMMAHRFEELGVKAGDRISYVGTGISADWLRIAKVRVVAEVPVRYERLATIVNNVDANEEYSTRFFELDEPSREKVYEAFRTAGAVIAVTNRIPQGGTPGDWTRLLDPDDARYPKTTGQVLEQSPGYYRWLEPRGNH